jgi:hypothetical protein
MVYPSEITGKVLLILMKYAICLVSQAKPSLDHIPDPINNASFRDPAAGTCMDTCKSQGCGAYFIHYYDAGLSTSIS